MNLANAPLSDAILDGTILSKKGID